MTGSVTLIKGPLIFTRKRDRRMATNGRGISFQVKEPMTQKFMACAPKRTSFFWGGKFREVLQFKKKLRDEGARKGPWEGVRWKFEMNS